MKAHAKLGIITPVVAVPAFALGHLIWPPSPDMMPTATQVPWLMGMSALESLSLGLGIAFLLVVGPMLKALPEADRKKHLPAFLAVAWLLINWWPHDNLHAANGMNIAGLIRIEYFFHATLILCGVILSRYVSMLLAERRDMLTKPAAQPQPQPQK